MKTNSDIEIYQSSDGKIEVEGTFENETVWLNQEQLSQLFNRDRTVIGRYIRNIFKEKELFEEVVCADFAHTTQHGALEGKTQTKTTKYYNLDVILSVGRADRAFRKCYTKSKVRKSKRCKAQKFYKYSGRLWLSH